LLSLAALPGLLSLARAIPTLRPASPPPLLALYLLLTLGMGLTIALLPPTDWDGLFYHLTGPKLYLSAGRIAPGVDIPHLNFPALLEMLFLLAMAIRGDVTAKLVHFGFSLLLAGLVYRMARRHLRLKNGWLAVAFLFSMPMVMTLAGWAYNDLALAFFEVAALDALLRWRSEPAERRWLTLSGVLCGMAMSLKYTSVVAVVALGLLLLGYALRRRAPLRQITGDALRFAFPALLVSSPWYIKNWLFTGNPVYPFLFGGRYWDSFRAAAYSGAGTGTGFDLPVLLSLPYQLTLGLHDANYIDGRSGPLFLAFLPLLLLYGLLRYRRDVHPPALGGMLWFALAQYLFWTAGVIASAGLWQSRLLLPAFVVLCPSLAWLLDDLHHLAHPQFSLRRFLTLFIGLVLALGLIDQTFNNQIQSRSGWLYYRPWSHLLGVESRADYLTRRLGAHYTAMRRLNAELPPDAVVAFLWEPRSYYCRLDCRPDSILDEYGHLQYRYGRDAAAIARAWRARGVTHVLVFRAGLDFLLEETDPSSPVRPDPALLRRLQAGYLTPVFDEAGAYQVYRLR
ncbi:MAG: phospholipid carrier-dependent glycosyltransferase, partial [Caldilineae bacterium]